MPISYSPYSPPRDKGIASPLRALSMTTTQPLRIIAVDDNPADLCLLNVALQESGVPHTAQTFTDGGEAERFCRWLGSDPSVRRPDLILLDLNLGPCDGFEVLQTIRSNPFLDATPVVIVSTSQRGDDVVKSYELKANAYMFKSSSLEESFFNVRLLLQFWWKMLRDPEAA